MQPTPSRRQFVAALGAAPFVPSLALQDDASERKLPTLRATLILVRHAEKSDDDQRDPNLSEAGKARADAFASMFAAAGVTGLIHSGLKRTRDTVAPLAEALKLESESIPANDSAALVKRLTAAKEGEVITIAGHSNTIPALAWAFGVLLPDLDRSSVGPNLPYGYLPHGAYDRVHVLTPAADGARLLELRHDV